MKNKKIIIPIVIILGIIIICCASVNIVKFMLSSKEKSEEINDQKYLNWEVELGQRFHIAGFTQDGEKLYVLGSKESNPPVTKQSDYNEELKNCDEVCLITIEKSNGEIEKVHALKGYADSLDLENTNIIVSDQNIFVNIFDDTSETESKIYQVNKSSEEEQVLYSFTSNGPSEMAISKNHLILSASNKLFVINTETSEVEFSNEDFCMGDLFIVSDRYIYYQTQDTVIKLDMKNNYLKVWEVKYPGEMITSVTEYKVIEDVLYVAFDNDHIELYNDVDGKVIKSFLLQNYEDEYYYMESIGNQYPQIDSSGKIFSNPFNYIVVNPTSNEIIYEKSWTPNFYGCQEECYSLGVKNVWYSNDHSVINVTSRGDDREIVDTIEIINNYTGEVSQVFNTSLIIDGYFTESDFIGLSTTGEIIRYNLEGDDMQNLGQIFLFQSDRLYSSYMLKDDSSIYFANSISSGLVSLRNDYAEVE